jgi:hypothetical protein
MKAVLKLELIGDDTYEFFRLRAKETAAAFGPQVAAALFGGMGKGRPWVARITGTDPRYRFKREFIPRQARDYSEANSVGSRGVYAYYTLSDGVYEVSERVSWKRTARYFIRVADGQIEEIGEEEVLECLSESASA